MNNIIDRFVFWWLSQRARKLITGDPKNKAILRHPFVLMMANDAGDLIKDGGGENGVVAAFYSNKYNRNLTMTVRWFDSKNVEVWLLEKNAELVKLKTAATKVVESWDWKDVLCGPLNANLKTLADLLKEEA